MFRHSYREYEVDVADVVRQRKLATQAQRHQKIAHVSETRDDARVKFHSWLKAMRVSFQARLQPVEDEGYIA